MRTNYIVAGATVTPSDSTALTITAVRMGDAIAADIALRFVGGDTITFTDVQPGELIFGDIDRVMATNTTATLIQGLEVR